MNNLASKTRVATPMFCPLCQSQLIAGPDRRYETLDEHICNPNGVHRKRGTLVCSNQKCQVRWAKFFWADDGEGPYGSNFEEPLWIDGNPLPFGSYHRGVYFSCGYHKEDRSFTLGKLTIRREVTYKSDDYGHKTGKRVRYIFWWNNMLYIPGIRMLFFSLGMFYRNKKLGEKFVVKEIKEVIERAKWPSAEWWRKANCLYIRLFHPALYRKASL